MSAASRPFVIVGRSDRHGRPQVVVECPWCSARVEADRWSLDSGGKRCECGALLLGRYGLAWPPAAARKVGPEPPGRGEGRSRAERDSVIPFTVGPCPYCRAAAGEVCRTPSGARVLGGHGPRRAAAEGRG